MGLILSGISVSRGVAIGKAYLMKRDDLEISEYEIPKHAIAEEVARFRAALKKTIQQFKNIRKRIPAHAPAEIAAFIDAHLLMIDDSTLSDAPVRIIKQQQCNAEWALKLQRDDLVSVFNEMEDPYLRTRKDDVDHVVNRIQRNLTRQSDQIHEVPDRWLKNGIVVADDLAPADTMLMQQLGVAALVTEYGGPNSHTAILARSLGIPAIVGVHQVRRYLKQNELLVIDGRRGIVFAAPDQYELDHYQKCQREHLRFTTELDKVKKKPALTRDGQYISLQANIETPEDMPLAKRVAAMGVGLYRTEMLFMNRDDMPGEEEQYQSYLQIVRALKGAPLTIRTLDLGADKQLNYNTTSNCKAANPAMGLRAIRWCLKDPDLFRPQVRAILRASYHGAVRMMIPMLSTVQELIMVLKILEEEKRSLSMQKKKYDDDMPIGGMIEVPAAAMIADAFAEHLDFLSIGTNDLIQYTLAVDRLDDEISYLYDPLHPAILRLIKMTIDAGKKADIPVAMCGEMAGDIHCIRLLLGMGLKEFSMYPATLLEVKRIINTSDVAALGKLAKKALKMSDPDEIAKIVDKMNTL